MTLARQMYPCNPMKFMDVFNNAVKTPYGCLTVDLKPFTQDLERLKSNVLNNQASNVVKQTNDRLNRHIYIYE